MGIVDAVKRVARSLLNGDVALDFRLSDDVGASGSCYPACMSTALRDTPRITDRQRQVVDLIAAGCSNAEVARRLGISARTAKAHSDVLRQKLGVARRRQIPRAYRELTGDDPFSRAL